MLSGTDKHMLSPRDFSNGMRGLTRTATLTDSPLSSFEKMDWLVEFMLLMECGAPLGLTACSKLET